MDVRPPATWAALRTLNDEPNLTKSIIESELPAVNSAVTERLDARRATLTAERLPPDTAPVAAETDDPSRVYDRADKLLPKCPGPETDAVPFTFREFDTLKPLPSRQKLAIEVELPSCKEPSTLSELASLASERTETLNPTVTGPNEESSAPRLLCWSIEKLLPRRANLRTDKVLPRTAAPAIEALAIDPKVAQPCT